MKTTRFGKKSLFIVDNDPEVTIDLKNLLETEFPDMFDYFLFHTGLSALDECNSRTDIVIINNFLTGENGTSVAEQMKKVNPNIHIVMLTSSQEILMDLEEFCERPIETIKPPIKKRSTYEALKNSRILYPFQYLGREFRARKFVFIFIVTFILVGLTSFIFLRYIND